jgi:AbiV family abortive infection protein
MQENPEKVEWLRCVFANADRLHTDAELLADHGRHRSSYALALLGIEELGKALIDLWRNDAWWDSPSPSDENPAGFSFHVRKQVAFATLLLSGEVLSSMRQRHTEGFDAEKFRAIYKEAYEGEGPGLLVAGALFGILNEAKESSFYVDRPPSPATWQADESAARDLLEKYKKGSDWLRDWSVCNFARPTYFHALRSLSAMFKRGRFVWTPALEAAVSQRLPLADVRVDGPVSE